MRLLPATRRLRPISGVLAALLIGAALLAQRGGGGGGFLGGGQVYVPPGTRTAREIPTRSTGTPVWENPPRFASDVFTFARLRYDAAPRPTYASTNRWRGGWTTDFPDADLNLSFRLQQMTSLKVDPNARIVRATDPELADFPFLFAVSPGAMALTEEETVALRAYLRNGGFLLMTDFWGDDAWDHVERLFRTVLPESRFEELPIEHPLYRCVFTIREKAQVPNIRIGLKIPGTTIHHRVIFDAKGRLMVMGLHNSDDSDGWEREGEDHEYFKNYSEKIAYPLAVNIIFYVLTH
ncbi:MAG: hypothetical protein RLZZ15_1929 [Verrucomicrobiota bacterium]|jgi:hypothetical protein